MLKKSSRIWALVLSVLLWAQPFGLALNSFAQVEADDYRCQDANCHVSASRTVSLVLFSTVWAILFTGIYKAFQEKKDKVSTTGKGGSTPGGGSPNGGTPIASGGTDSGVCIETPGGNQCAHDPIGPTRTRGCPDGGCTQDPPLLPPGGTVIEIQDKTVPACQGTCSEKRYVNLRNYKFKSFRLQVPDEQGKIVDNGIRLSRDPAEAAATIRNLEASGVIDPGALVSKDAERIMRELIGGNPANPGLQFLERSVMLQDCTGNCECILSDEKTPASTTQGEVVRGVDAWAYYSRKPYRLGYEYEFTADAEIYNGTCEKIDEEDL